MAFDPDAYLEKTAPKETKAFDPDAYLSQAPAPAEEPPVEKPSMLAGTKLEPELPVQPLSSPVDLESLPKFDASKMPTAEDRAVAAFGITPEMGMGEKTLRTAKSSLKDASNALEQKWLGGARLISDITGLKKEEIKGVSGQFNKEQNAVAKTYESDYGLKMAKNIGSSVISNLPTMGVGLYAGTTAALTNMFGDSFLQTYDDSRNEGLGVGASTVRSTLYGTAEALGESLGLPYLLKGAKDALKGVPTAQLAKDLAHYMVKEIPGEQLTYISQFLTDKGFNMNPEAGLTEFLQGMKDTALVTVGQTAVMGGAGFATNKVLKDLRDHHSKGEDGIPKAADMVKEVGFNFNRPAATPEAPITPEAAAPEAAVPQAVTQQATELPPMVAPTVPESQNKDIMMAELEGRPIPPERPEVPPVVAPAAAAPIPKEQTIGEQTKSQLKDLYKQQGSLLKQKDDLNVFLRKNGINTQDRSDMGIQPSESRNYAGVFRNKAQRLDVLMHSAMEKGIISEADLARFPDAVEGFRQMAKDAIDGNVAQTPQNMANMAQMKSLQDQIDSLESIPKEQYGLKAETAEETQSRIKQEAAARKAQEDAAIQADMDAQAERDRAEIARRSAEQAQNFGLGQTPEESLTGQRRIDDLDADIPFEKPLAEPTTKLLDEYEVIAKNLRSSMDEMGLSHVGLKIADSLVQKANGVENKVNGAYFDNMIHVAMTSDNKYRTLNHEALHSMRDHGFFTDKDWSILSSKAAKEWMKKYDIANPKKYGDRLQEIQIEEAIAHAFADYRTQTPEIKSIMTRAIETLKRIGNVFRGRGFKTANDIFKSAGKGKLSATQASSINEPKFEKVKPTKHKNYLGEPAPLSQWDMPTDSKTERFIYRIQDKYIDTKRAIQAIKDQVGEIADKWDAYLKEELYHGRTAKKTQDFLNDELLPIVKEMQKSNINLPEFDEYLHNRHAEERNIQIAKINPAMPDSGSGIATQDSKDYLAKLDPAKAKSLENMAKQIDKIIQKTQKILVNAGLESQDTIDIWNKTYKKYVPLMREDLDFSQKFGGTGAGFSTKGGSSKRAVGSLKEVADIFANVASQRERAIVRAEKARVGTALYGLAIQNPNPEFWLAVNPDAIKNEAALIKELQAMGLDAQDAKSIIQEPKTPYIDEKTGLVAYRVNPLLRNSDNVFPVRIDGKDRFIFFNPNDERAMRMVSAIKNLDAEGLGLILGNAAKVTRWIASVNTQYNPVFGAYNFIRDVGGAQFNLTTTPIAGKQKEVTKHVFPALKGIYKDLRSERAGEGAAPGEWSQLWEEFQREGGSTGYRDQFSMGKDELNIIERQIEGLNHGKIRQGAKAVFDWLSDYNDALENAVRLSAYKVALDQGISKERAASIAKNLTVNFNRKGAWGQQAGALYAFFNASVQGSTRLYETLTGPQGKKIIAGGLLLGSVQAIALAMAGFDDNDPSEFVKERNIVIPLPNGKYIAIPMPLGLHVIPNIGRLTTEMVMNGGKGSAKKIGNLLGVMMDSFNPIGNSGLSMQTLAPTLLDPAAAIMENKDAFGRPIAKEDRATNPTPGYTRSRDTASFISKELSKFLNYASGGTKYQKGLVSPTADQLDYLIGQATGGVGREVLKAEQAVTSLATGEELPSYKVPLVGKFYGDVGSQASQANKFYDNITNMANHENEVKGRIKNREDVNSYYRDHPEARLYTQANTAENEITKINKEKRDAIERNSPPAVIKRIEDRKTAIMKRFNDRVSKAER